MGAKKAAVSAAGADFDVDAFAAAGAGAPVCGFFSVRVYARIRVAALEVHAEKFSFFGHARIYPSAARGVKRLVASGVGIVQLVSR